MNTIWDKVINVLNDQQIKDFFSGKTSPVIKTENTVTVAKETLKTAGEYIIIGFVASAVIIGIAIKWSVSSGAKYVVRNSGQRL